MSNGFRRASILCAPLVALSLTACGVKNLPQAPGGEGVPGAAVEPQRGGGLQILGAGGDASDPTRAPQIAVGGSDYGDDRITTAEVTRIPGARRKTFFLDPLLN
ncbi:hypothetical protein U0C82_07070 [Fulvimarina sp. 2208YS6-2-32]|uniref:Uncharacterized protein n=2 Tax=Fulvimarina uroteuthidis TaxID=3098149 RepID=A0ABU5I0J1_9HYPH|nr:hypothetical protein [Fulvimarina sp. 2208YS6-2-32]